MTRPLLLKLASFTTAAVATGTFSATAMANTSPRIVSYYDSKHGIEHVIVLNNHAVSVNGGSYLSEFVHTSSGWSVHSGPSASTFGIQPATGSPIVAYYDPNTDSNVLWFIDWAFGRIQQWEWPETGNISNPSPTDANLESEAPYPFVVIQDVVTNGTSMAGFVDSYGIRTCTNIIRVPPSPVGARTT